MEQNLFSWENWDSVDNFILQFIDCKLKLDVGEYKEGDSVPVIVMDMENSLIQFMTYEGDILKEFNLVLSIGEK